LKQRIDTPYIRENGRLVKTSWSNAFQKIKEKIQSVNPNEIAGFVGDLMDLESMFVFKSFFNKVLNSNNLECRQKEIYLNPKERMNYIFNSTIEGIEDSDLILLIGTNPRLEATILNSRIRKSYLKNKTEIFSIGNPGDLTYPYKILGEDTSVLDDIYQNKNVLSEKIKNASKPLIIIGESSLYGKKGKYIFESMKKFLFDNKKINNDWNSLNFLTQQASKVGAIDLGIFSIKNKDNNYVLNGLKNNEYKLVYLLGADEIKFDKKEEFIIYQGTHGDKGAHIADVVLPGSAYTEKDGHYINLEGRIQKGYKASYPPGDSKEDWKIILDLSMFLGFSIGFETKNDLEKKLKNSNKFFLKFDAIESIKSNQKLTTENVEFFDSKIEIEKIDYYFTNYISRASKTMNECKNEKNKLELNGVRN